MAERLFGIPYVVINDNNYQLADTALREKRLQVCSTCPEKVEDLCSKCGCLIVVKTSGEDATCPIGSW